MGTRSREGKVIVVVAVVVVVVVVVLLSFVAVPVVVVVVFVSVFHYVAPEWTSEGPQGVAATAISKFQH